MQRIVHKFIGFGAYLKFESSSVYHALPNTGVLTLPSEGTLRDYTHWVIGFQPLSTASNKCMVREEYFTLVFDIMKVREDLVFNKHSCRLVGFVHF